MKKIYPAGPFSWQKQILAHANTLRALGFEITGEWLTQECNFTNPDNTTNTKKPGLHADCERLSVRDLSNIAESDTLLLFEPGTAVERNTRVAEFGVALAWGLQCIVIQPPEPHQDVISNIFVKLHSGMPRSLDLEQTATIRVGKIKPVLEFRSFEDFYKEILTARAVDCCQGCGAAYDDRDCGCPAGSFQKYRTKSRLYVPQPPAHLVQGMALATVK